MINFHVFSSVGMKMMSCGVHCIHHYVYIFASDDVC